MKNENPKYHNDLQAWTECFRALGACDPESWARSQIEESIPQYARFVFLRQAWQNVVTDGDTSWIAAEIAASEQRLQGPGASVGPALKRMLAAGVSCEDITEVVRAMQWIVLSGIAYQLDDSEVVEYPKANMPQVNWALFELDVEGRPSHPIGGLHESVLETDPTGREMAPKHIE